MIIIVHHKQRTTQVLNNDKELITGFVLGKEVVKTLREVVEKFPKDLVIWCERNYLNDLDFDEFEKIFHHKCIMASYSITGNYCISSRIGYVEQTPFTNIANGVNFPTWFMSSDVGGIFSETLNAIFNTVPLDENLDYFLTSLAKHNMPLGLFCYSNSKFLKRIPKANNPQRASIYSLFKFVKQHYKSIWIFNLFICLVIFERRLPILPFLYALFFKRNLNKKYLNPLDYKSTKSEELNQTMDVIIPTIGRKEYLYNILKDLSEQTVLPKNVIVIEQSISKPSISELDYITNQSWPFNIIHKITSNTGVCKARNTAIKHVESDWCFFADDDIRIEPNFVENAFKTIEVLGVEVLNMLCLQPHEKQMYFCLSQTGIFGSGASIVKTSFFNKVAFDTSFEFGFGEDSDFGMQLRNVGADIIFIPTIKIIHLKAPIGGFRTKYVFEWEHQNQEPKPSPMIMVFVKKYYNRFQMNGYKYVLFLKFYRMQTIKNPFKYLISMQKKWEQSMYWADKLIKDNA